MKWRNKNLPEKQLTAIQLKGSSIASEISKLSSKFDDIVIDSGVGESLEQSLSIADRLIVPFNSKDMGLWTVWTLTNLETAVDRAWDINPDLKAYSFFISKPDERDAVKNIINTLRKSQYINYIDDSPLHKELFGKAMEGGYSIYDLKHPEKSFISSMSDIFENVQN